MSSHDLSLGKEGKFPKKHPRKARSSVDAPMEHWFTPKGLAWSQGSIAADRQKRRKRRPEVDARSGGFTAQWPESNCDDPNPR